MGIEKYIDLNEKNLKNLRVIANRLLGHTQAEITLGVEKALRTKIDENSSITPLIAEEIYRGVSEYSAIPIQDMNKNSD